MSRHFVWWVVELVIWYFVVYIFIFAVKNPVSIGWTSFVILLLSSLGVFASPLTRHLSIWNKILDKVVRKEEDIMKY